MVDLKIGIGLNKYDAKKLHGVSGVEIDGKFYDLRMGAMSKEELTKEPDTIIIPLNYYWLVKRSRKEEEAAKQYKQDLVSKKTTVSEKNVARMMLKFMKDRYLKL